MSRGICISFQVIFFFFWIIVALEYCVSFWWMAKWISSKYIGSLVFLDFLPFEVTTQHWLQFLVVHRSFSFIIYFTQSTRPQSREVNSSHIGMTQTQISLAVWFGTLRSIAITGSQRRLFCPKTQGYSFVLLRLCFWPKHSLRKCPPSDVCVCACVNACMYVCV